MKKILSLIISSSLTLTGCSIQVSKGNVYQSPADSLQNATVRLKNKTFLQSAVGDMAYMPSNILDFARIDGRPVSIFQNDTVRIPPGKHVIQINCKTNYRVVGSGTIILRALPGRIYEISYPDEMYGYTIDYSACQKIIVRTI